MTFNTIKEMKPFKRCGVSIIELTVAMAISAVLLSILFYTWNTFNFQIAQRDHVYSLRDETIRIAEEITTNIRRTPSVLDYSLNSIRFISPTHGDTVEYRFDGEQLSRNGKTVTNRAYGGEITSFEIRGHNTQIGSEHILLEILLTSSDRRDNRDTVRSIVGSKTVGDDDNKFWW
ncbi:prepilin-type N-terminal cleavage/methylation domain-containing protein [Chitinispirillales bacterium ANBcel5]|uniref:prepilin-type N-terminal cleavage/methylation domain-containing protein n=1 Tax=Cellulosispirillum alkaliphilum TaxID=3039283 RepID=UPI002A54F3B0|nr:prepilin-type N-terminal cleavage/methylation domain-containing protein [Chitinispirillales bacterium ANBcel5]